MVVTYPDGNQVTWQFPMVEFRGVFQGMGPGGGLFFTDPSGKTVVFGAPFEALVRLNGRTVLRRQVPAGARVVALARRTNPNLLTLLDFSK
jgi:hypothetical protein